MEKFEIQNIIDNDDIQHERMDIKELTLKELQDYIMEIGYPKVIANQIFSWINKRYVFNFDEMLDISADLKRHLSHNFCIPAISIKTKIESEMDDTVKYLFELNDGHFVEATSASCRSGHTVCISTQVGCKMGCEMCASPIGGFVRNLTVGEMLDQILLIKKEGNVDISNLVLMGVGEPLENLDNILKLLKILPAMHGLHLANRKVTISTCGLVDKIKELMAHNLQINLSVSLNATNNKMRDLMMPINKKWNIESLMEVIDEYSESTQKKVIVEYVLIKGVNDSEENAQELANLLKGKNVQVCLIPLNNIKERNLERSLPKDVFIFKGIVRKAGISVILRRDQGMDINASWGQLRGR